jgi:hypothetical protein
VSITYVKQATALCEHEVLKMPVTYAKEETNHTVPAASTRQHT